MHVSQGAVSAEAADACFDEHMPEAADRTELASPLDAGKSNEAMDQAPHMPDLTVCDEEYLKIVNLLAAEYDAQRYLEISSGHSSACLYVDMPDKTIVAPSFPAACGGSGAEGLHLRTLDADSFLDSLTEQQQSGDRTEPFDIIAINGIYSFAESYRFFEKSLPHAHANTIWLIDGTLPTDAYSVLTPREFSLAVREKAGLSGTSWQGDTFKTVCAIHDFYPHFSYCTVPMTHGRTLVWRSGDTGRAPVWASLESIDRLGYADLLAYAALFMPTPRAKVLGLMGLALCPMQYNNGSQWERLCFGALQSDNTLGASGACMSCGKLTAKLVKKEENRRLLHSKLKTIRTRLRATKRSLRAAQKPITFLEYMKRLVSFNKA